MAPENAILECLYFSYTAIRTVIFNEYPAMKKEDICYWDNFEFWRYREVGAHSMNGFDKIN